MTNANDRGVARDMLPMTVAKMGFLVDRLNKDCSPLQFLRELTKNSIEGILQLPGQQGEIRWDVDWNRFQLLTGSEAVQKLCVIDTGVGMTGPEMLDYINKLSSSIHEQSATGNFGVGAKISAAPLNPEGLVYLSWKNGVGHMIHLRRDPETGDYGLERFKSGEFWARVQDDIKPDPIDQNGTMVVLLGNSLGDNTIEPPPGSKMPRKWLLRYLNSRFFQFPSGIEVKAREGWNLPRGDQHNFLRTVTGEGPWLDENSQSGGIVDLPQMRASVRWWILKSTADVNSGHYTPGGHVAALFQDELYELVHGPAGYARLQSFGVIFGGDRVVLYVEPETKGERSVTANTARTQLLIEGSSLDWPGYATEFRELMPQELRDYQDEIGSAANHTDHREAIRERLKSIRELFRFGRYRPRPGGKFSMANPGENTGGDPVAAERAKSQASSPSGGRGGRTGDIYSLFTDEGGVPAERVDLPVEPDVTWIIEENGSRQPGVLDDRAARYLPDQNRLLINGDFRAFVDMIDRWEEKYSPLPGIRTTITEVVREWFEQQLIETVMSALALKGEKWSMEELSKLWDETALTAAVLPRYHIDISIKRVLGQRLGRLTTAA